MSRKPAILAMTAWAAFAVELGAPAPPVPLVEPAGGSLSRFRGGRVMVLAAEAEPDGLEAARSELKRRGVELVRAPLPKGGLWLVDEEGVLRAIESAPGKAERLVGLLEEWELGKKSFEWGCPTCHGKNGRETHYYGVKSLGGVGNRMSREQIRRTLNATMIAPGRYSIRCFHYSERELEALVTYVAGL